MAAIAAIAAAIVMRTCFSCFVDLAYSYYTVVVVAERIIGSYSFVAFNSSIVAYLAFVTITAYQNSSCFIKSLEDSGSSFPFMTYC